MNREDMLNRPVYPIGIVAEMLDVHPETIRVWERSGVLTPGRRSGRRFYSENDLRRLKFIKRLTEEEGLNIPAVRHYLKLYPCWQMEECPACMHRSGDASCTKPCWKEEGVYCQVKGGEDLCSTCEYRRQKKIQEPTAIGED